ncbi:MAG TPA: hypothetical protein VJC03_08905, partial [bacterium]|nr:hypothetical protein [bacterium]
LGKVRKVKPGKDVVETLYISRPEYGSHKLICVGKNMTELNLTSHPDNEEFILIDPERTKKDKPLILVVGLWKDTVLEKKARAGKLAEKDILAIRVKYNNPELSLFTMLAGAPHWEATLPGKGTAPAFFVTEPSRLGMKYLDLGSYRLELKK